MIYQSEQQQLDSRAREIRLLLLDVDGVMTDGSLYVGDSGEELKVFNSLDGHGIKLLQRAGVNVGIISGRNSLPLSWRANELGIHLLFKGREDKLCVLEQIAEEQCLPYEEIAYAGDDLPDLAVIDRVGLGISVPNGHAEVKKRADLLTEKEGGRGAVREICDFLLQARGAYDRLIKDSLGR
ncbi:MAG: HAD hydrolase family protein [Gammaproteobacteria bacterium]|jgi:3-deoxy-D-manno-octulosonate 8-phosphate phosphatase (KDO 8-P phosphatase)